MTTDSFDLNMYVQFLNDNAKLPTVANAESDLGYDVYSAEEVVVQPHTQALIGTGIAVDASGFGFGFIVKDRSSMAVKGMYTHAGVIDAGYRGEVTILLENTTQNPYKVGMGDKIAQLLPYPVLTFMVPVSVESLSTTDRGSNGFGSTGV